MKFESFGILVAGVSLMGCSGDGAAAVVEGDEAAQPRIEVAGKRRDAGARSGDNKRARTTDEQPEPGARDTTYVYTPSGDISALWKTLIRSFGVSEEAGVQSCQQVVSSWTQRGINALRVRTDKGNWPCLMAFLNQAPMEEIRGLELTDTRKFPIEGRRAAIREANEEMKEAVGAAKWLTSFYWTGDSVGPETVDWIVESERNWSTFGLLGDIGDEDVSRLLGSPNLSNLDVLGIGNAGSPRVTRASLDVIARSPLTATLTKLIFGKALLERADLLAFGNAPFRTSLTDLYLGFDDPSLIDATVFALFPALKRLAFSRVLSERERERLWAFCPRLEAIVDANGTFTRSEYAARRENPSTL